MELSGDSSCSNKGECYLTTIPRAVALALRYAFCELGMEIVRSACLRRNPAPARVLQKNGFLKTDGVLFNRGKFNNEPARQFRLTKQEWLAVQSEEICSTCRSPISSSTSP